MNLWRGAQSAGKRVRFWGGRCVLILGLFLGSACQNAETLHPQVLMTGLRAPSGLAFNNYCTLCVAESGSGRVLALRPGSRETWVIREGFEELSGLAVDRENTMYVAARGTSGQSCVYAISRTGRQRPYCDQLKGPCGLSTDWQGNLLIAESASGRVLRIRRSGEFEVLKQGLSEPKRALDVRGMLVFVCARGLYTDLPGKLCGIFSHIPGRYDGIAASAKDGSLYALDTLRKRLLYFDSEGSLRKAFDCAAAGLADITALACDRDGMLYAATASGKIVGLPMGAWGAPVNYTASLRQDG